MWPDGDVPEHVVVIDEDKGKTLWIVEGEVVREHIVRVPIGFVHGGKRAKREEPARSKSG